MLGNLGRTFYETQELQLGKLGPVCQEMWEEHIRKSGNSMLGKEGTLF